MSTLLSCSLRNLDGFAEGAVSIDPHETVRRAAGYRVLIRVRSPLLDGHDVLDRAEYPTVHSQIQDAYAGRGSEFRGWEADPAPPLPATGLLRVCLRSPRLPA